MDALTRDLFADVPRARNSDPRTSHTAAARIKATGALGRQQSLVLEYVRRWPGHTSAELARRMAIARDDDARMWVAYRHMVARRTSELHPTRIRRGASRVCDVCGSDCLTWYPCT